MGHYSIAFVGQHMSSSSYLLYRERKKTFINTKKWCEELLFEGNLGTFKVHRNYIPSAPKVVIIRTRVKNALCLQSCLQRKALDIYGR